MHHLRATGLVVCLAVFCLTMAGGCREPGPKREQTAVRVDAGAVPSAASQPNSASRARGHAADSSSARASDTYDHDVRDAAARDDDDDGLLPVVTAVGTGAHWVVEVAKAIVDSRSPVRAKTLTTSPWTWVELAIDDLPFPLTVDIIGSNEVKPRGVVYMLPGGATNFRASFLVPGEDSLAHCFREHGYLVVGITPREDRVPASQRDLSFMKQWGMQQHREDIRSVVSLVQSVVPLPYELLGHSYGAASALDYASVYPGEAQRVIALDIYSIDPLQEPMAMRDARLIYDAYSELMQHGLYADATYYDFGEFARPGLEPTIPGSTGLFEDPERYTAKQLLLFGMIYSAYLPGVHSELTGLPGDWPLEQSTVAGHYFTNEMDDEEHEFTRTRSATLREVSEELGDGLISMAFARDYWSVTAFESAYSLDWGAIRGDVVWLNSELGYAGHTYGAELIRQNGKARIEVAVIPGYGHADVLWSKTARADVWERLFGER